MLKGWLELFFYSFLKIFDTPDSFYIQSLRGILRNIYFYFKAESVHKAGSADKNNKGFKRSLSMSAVIRRHRNEQMT